MSRRAPAACPEREVRDEHDALLGAVIDHVFGAAFGQVVMVLHGRDRDDRPRELDLVDPHLRQSDVADLPRVPRLGERADAVLERCLGMDAVQVVEVDRLRPQPP
jgi:hypothetical protein